MNKVKPTLSIVVITKDEEVDLPGFLENFSLIADEIVIIDDGSIDKTKEIAYAFGEPVRFIVSPRCPEEGFCDQRNKGVKAARCEWLLQVDCDMRITPELAKEILASIEKREMAAYRFRLSQYFLGHKCCYGGLQYWNQAWLCRRNVVSWTQKLHERIQINESSEKIGQLKGKMIHLNDQDFSERMRKNYQYSHLEAERMLCAGERTSVWKLVSRPFWRSLRAYIFMRGFLDGRIGFLWALYQFTSMANAYFIAWDRENRVDRSEIDRRVNQRMASTFQLDKVK